MTPTRPQQPALPERDGLRLAYLDFGGDGPPVLFLHGLAGHAGEWAETAQWLTGRARVVALDARGHGGSERNPADVSQRAHVDDVAFVIEQLALGPVVLVGQSLGGLTAFLVAAEHPGLVRGLVVGEASPERDEEAAVEEAEHYLASWPVPFASREAAVAFFGGPSLRAESWADGLESREDGLWPRFEVAVMSRTLRAAASRSHWTEWDSIQCPALVVRAERGAIAAGEAGAMVARLPGARLVELSGAGHDLHLDRPQEWRTAISEFLDSVDAGSA
ncbi:MAG: alpha/beta fold hydrolase [Solirubrobacterales bacterium]